MSVHSSSDLEQAPSPTRGLHVFTTGGRIDGKDERIVVDAATECHFILKDNDVCQDEHESFCPCLTVSTDPRTHRLLRSLGPEGHRNSRWSKGASKLTAS